MSESRDYSLTGVSARSAVLNGLAQAQWYVCPVDRTVLKSLMRRRNGPAVRDTLIWLAALAASGALAFHFRGHWTAIPFFALYGVLYGSASDSRWHECGHGTAFKTDWMNNAVYLIACVMMLREPMVWRWSHARHHTDTLVVGRDPEIANPRPVSFTGLLLDLFAIRTTALALRSLVIHTCGRLTPADRNLIAEADYPRVFRDARIGLSMIVGLIAVCVAGHSVLPALFVGLPTLYGAPLGVFFSTTQHAGLAENVLDHRRNCRTVYMNPAFRFLYWNMNYHLEHHLFPMVPFHSLRRLHEAIRVHLPPPYTSNWAAYREILPALWRQRTDADWFVERPMPRSVS